MTVTTKSTSLALRYSKTLADLATKVGANREITVCDEDKRPYLHDGVTEGGIPLAMQSDLEGLGGGGGSTQTAEEIEAALDTHYGSDMWRRNIDVRPLTDYVLEVIQGDFLEVWMGYTNDNFGEPVLFEVTGSTDFTQSGNTLNFNSNVIGTQTLNITATGSRDGVDTSTITINILERVNTAPQIDDKFITTLVGVPVKVTLGSATDIDGDTVTYTVTTGTGESFSQTPLEMTYAAGTIGSFLFDVAVLDSNGLTSAYQITVTVIAELPDGVSNYLTHTNVIAEDYGTGRPEKMVPFIEPISGCRVTRMTDAPVDMEETPEAALNGYSRYSQENSDGSMILAVGSNSTSSTILNKYSGEVIAFLANDDSGSSTETIGMFHEIRWDTSGNHPTRVYYMVDQVMMMIDDVTKNDNSNRSNPTRSVLKDFSTEMVWPAAADGQRKRVYNDQEGAASDDSDHWAFMAAYNNGSSYSVAAFVHYQISTDTTHIMYPADLAGTNLDSWKNDQHHAVKPNMVEVSPLGTGIVIHNGRGWGSSAVIGTWFDGPHLWPIDFDHATNPPFRIAMDAAHSGWAWGHDGREMFVYQDNRRDVLSATYVSGDEKGFALDSSAGPGANAGLGTVDFYQHIDMSWTSFHFGRMPRSHKGWIQVSTYHPNAAGAWAHDQLFMVRIQDMLTEGTLLWRVAPMFNSYKGYYFDEAPASMNLSGDAIYVSGNWGAAAQQADIYRYDLPKGWKEHLDAGKTKYAQTILIDNVEVS